MKITMLVLTLYAFTAVAWDKISNLNAVEDPTQTTVQNDDDYENGAYTTLASTDLTNARLAKYTYENGAYDAPETVKEPKSSRATD